MPDDGSKKPAIRIQAPEPHDEQPTHIPVKRGKFKLPWARKRSVVADSIVEQAGLQVGRAGVVDGYVHVKRLKNLKDGGHGFMAEEGNHIIDVVLGKKAIIGRVTTKGSADRIVNGVEIQSKYYRTPTDTVNAAFKNGKYVYFNKGDGRPMVLEVPRDQYDKAVQEMAAKISKGQVPAITDPAEAKNLVRKGHLTLKQAQNIGKSRSIDGIAYDVASSVVTSAFSCGISASASFCVRYWQTRNLKDSAKEAAMDGIKAGGITLVCSVTARQIARSETVKKYLDQVSKWAVKAVKDKWGKGGVDRMAQIVVRDADLKNVKAENHLKNHIQGNIISVAATVIVTSAKDVYFVVRGRISKRQLGKNVSGRAAGAIGGSAGSVGGSWLGGIAGGAIGGATVPGAGVAPGAVIGSNVGAFLGGMAAGAVSQMSVRGAIGIFVKDDAILMSAILQEVAQEIIEDNIMITEEVAILGEAIKKTDMPAKLREMYASADRHAFARFYIDGIVGPILASRERVSLPAMMMLPSINPFWIENRFGRWLWRMRSSVLRLVTKPQAPFIYPDADMDETA